MSPLTTLALTLLLSLLPPHGAAEESSREDKRFFMNMFNRRPLEDEPRTCSCTCGERNDASRIVGGKPAATNEFPWMVRLSYLNRFYCGGMLINDRYVLTAAHCVKGFMWFMIKVTFGEHDRCDRSRKPETRFVIRAVTGDFSYTNFDHDIAILRLNDRVPLTETIRPICLPSNSRDLYDGSKAIVTGWGTLKEDGKAVCILQELELPVMSNEQCKKMKYNAKMITDNMMCAGYLEGQKDSCQGDSGGPLITERADKRYELIGVVSWGNGCARPGFPGIYTRVTRYLDWIRNNTAGGCWCEDGASGAEPTTEHRGEQTTEKATKVTTDKTPEVTSEKTSEETTEKTSELTTEKTPEVTSEKTSEETTEKTSELTTEKTPEVTSEKTSEDTTEKTSELTTEKTPEVTSEKTSEETTEKTSELTTEKTPEVTSEKTSEETTEKTSDVTTEKTTELTTENIQEVTTRKTSDVMTEKTSELTTEKTADRMTNDMAKVTIETQTKPLNDSIVKI